MKITFAPIVSDARGRFGGLVLTAWRGVRVARRFRAPSNPKSTDQMLVRRIFQNATRAYALQNTVTRAAWVAFEAGKDFTARNAFIAKQVPALNDETDCDLMVGTPGDASTLVPTSATCTPGDTEISVAVVPPTPPTGWTVAACTSYCFLDSDWSSAPQDVTQVEATDEETPFTCLLQNLTNDVSYQVRSFITWLAPDASTRYSSAQIGQSTPAA
ncbi:hypothetical protein ES705_27480 [subsurface metagenome]